MATCSISTYGHQSVCDLLSAQYESGRIPHALLFQGPKGVGKRRVAQWLAGKIFACEGSAGSPQALLAAGSHPDFHVLSRPADKKGIATDSVRELIGKLHLKPYSGKRTISIVDEAHEMSVQAANSLLKTLEEPSEHCLLVLISSAPHKLLETIISRCQAVSFAELDSDSIASALTDIGALVDLDPEQIKTLSQVCNGSLESLELTSYLDEKTLAPLKPRETRKHLNTLVEKIDLYQSLINSTLQSANPTSAEFLSCSASLTASKSDQALVWTVLNSCFRQILRSPNCKRRNLWAKLFAEMLNSQALIAERNLSASLQLSNILLRACEIQKVN